MKSKLLKATVLATAAFAVGAMASATQAKTYTYTFATSSGTPYCDGMTLTTTDKVVYSGNHTGSCEGTAQYAGGFSGKTKTFKGIDVSTTDAEVPGFALTFLMDPKAMTWALYANVGGGFQFYNSGNLLNGAPPHAKKPGAKSSVFKNPKAVDKPF